MQVITLVEVAKHYRDNIVYWDNSLNIIELYWDITFPLSHSPTIGTVSNERDSDGLFVVWPPFFFIAIYSLTKKAAKWQIILSFKFSC